jgi:hypothetical protein
MNNCPSAPSSPIGTAVDESQKTRDKASVAVYVSIHGQGRSPLRFSSYAEKAAYYRGKVACTGSACDNVD